MNTRKKIWALSNPKFLVAAMTCYLSGSYVAGYINGVVRYTR